VRFLRGGILGAGHVALHGHVPGWREQSGVEILAAADPRREARAAMSEALPGVAWHDGAESLVASEDLDFLDVCTPPAFHGAAIRLGLERGLHVLCEKPLVLDPDELARLAGLADSRRLVLASVHNWRYSPILAEATRLVREGSIGTVRACRWEVLRERPSASAAAPSSGGTNWRLDPAVAGGGILVDHGWHAIYVLVGWIPGPIGAVSARLSTRRHHEWPVEDTAEVELAFGGGEAKMFLTWAAQERRNRAEIEGDRGAIRIDGARLSREGAGADGSWVREFPDSLSEGSHHADWFGGVAAEFLGAIRSPESDSSSKSLGESAICARVIRLAQESSRAGGRRLTMPILSRVPGLALEAAAAGPAGERA
jgi:predicted dehydrogenase